MAAEIQVPVGLADWDRHWNASAEERVIMCVEMAGYLRQLESEGVVRSLYAVREFGRVVEAAVRGLDGGPQGRVCKCADPGTHIVKYVGDMVMLWFPVTEAPAAIRCATKIVRMLEDLAPESGLRIRCKIGIAAGDVVQALHEFASNKVDPHGRPVDIAMQLVDIAMPRQILVEHAYSKLVSARDLELANGATGVFDPRPGLSKKVRGCTELVKVSAFVYPGEKAEIHNPPILRAELKRLGAALTDLLQQRAYVLDNTEEDLSTADTAASTLQRLEWLGAQTRSRSAGATLGQVRQVYKDCVELPEEYSVRELYDDLFRSYDAAKRSVRSLITRRNVDPDEWRDRARECWQDVDAVFENARYLQFHADSMIRRLDQS